MINCQYYSVNKTLLDAAIDAGTISETTLFGLVLENDMDTLNVSADGGTTTFKASINPTAALNGLSPAQSFEALLTAANVTYALLTEAEALTLVTAAAWDID